MAFGRNRKWLIKHLVLGLGRCLLLWLDILILVLGWQVLDDGLQLGDMANTFGHTLSEKHLSTHLQVLWMLDELEKNHRFLPCPQLLLWYGDIQ